MTLGVWSRTNFYDHIAVLIPFGAKRKMSTPPTLSRNEGGRVFQSVISLVPAVTAIAHATRNNLATVVVAYVTDFHLSFNYSW